MTIPTNIKNRKILLAVTGSIAIYKTLELIREFVKADADVKVVMSQSAKKFIAPLTFETLTANQVLDDTNESWANEHNHIQITQWADIMIIAPATANTIAKLAHGIADNILLQSALAFRGVKILAPSANTNMLYNPTTLQNLKMLENVGYTMIETQVKELACKTVGNGAMAEPLDIFYRTCRELLKEEFWEHRRVVVTGGGTIEKIDEVRYISNFSSGKMASALAMALYMRGADVTLIATKFADTLPADIKRIKVKSSQEMHVALVDTLSNKHIQHDEKKPYLFMAAAVSDYVAEFVQNTKLKKEDLGEKWALDLKKNIDILGSIDKEGITAIGFKAEMDKEKAKENAKKMLHQKKLDAVCLNILQDASSFGSNENEIEFITHEKVVHIPKNDKLNIAFAILCNAKELQE